MESAPAALPLKRDPLDEEAAEVYRRAMSALAGAGVRFLVGGAYALAHYTGIVRHTKDFDVFLRREDLDRALEALAGARLAVDRAFPHWLAKACEGDLFIDLIHSSGNGIAAVDDLWFAYAEPAEVLGLPALLCPAEEMIWSKSFVMERERYDGGDVAHLLRSRGPALDWDRLLARFAGPAARVLLAHLVLFGYVYPAERGSVPGWAMSELLRRLDEDDGPAAALCRGTLLSRSQYLVDVEEWGYDDARRAPAGALSDEDLALWTRAARDEEAKRRAG
jgi:hypothetical protein